MSNPSVGLRDMGARPTLAFQDAVHLETRWARFRLIPLTSSEASGSRALVAIGRALQPFPRSKRSRHVSAHSAFRLGPWTLKGRIHPDG